MNGCDKMKQMLNVSGLDLPPVAAIVAAGGRIEIVKGQKIYYVEVKVGEKPNGSYKNADWLRKTYHDECHTMQEIADMFNVTPMTINDWLKKHGIETRGRGRRV